MGAPRDSGIGRRVTAAEIEAAVVGASLPPLARRAALQFEAYLRLLLRWNAKFNLTAVREPSEIVRRHFLECIQCAHALPKAATLLDFGSGAGLPGIPIAIVCPEIRVTLGESQGRKVAFLREAVRVLDLTAEIYDGRIEKMPAGRVFEAVALRAVDRMADACREATRRLKAGGSLIAFATSKTGPGLHSASQGIKWKPPLPITGLDDAFLLIGEKEDVSRGTP